MARLPGFLKGEPKIWDPSVDLDRTDGYTITIKVTKVGVKRHFPLACFKDTVNYFTNDLVGKTLVVNKVSLEDLIKYQQIEYVIIGGLYWDQGFNPKIKKVINDLYSERKKLKSLENPMQSTLKLIMNAAYGKNNQKARETRKVIWSKKQFEQKAVYYHTSILAFEHINDRQVEVTLSQSVIDHTNYIHIGNQILSMSKRIMNEVMCLADDLNLKIYYQDTDSMHILAQDLPILIKAFKNKYNRGLVGKDMGQFHCDFDGFKGSVGEIHAIESVFLGKKVYCDHVQDEMGNQSFHIRLKGCNMNGILLACQERECTPIELYKLILRGEMVKFDLGAPITEDVLKLADKFSIEESNVRNSKFKRHKDLSMSNWKVGEFTRTIKYCLQEK